MNRRFAGIIVPLFFAALAAAGCSTQRLATGPKNWVEVSGGNWQPDSALLVEIANAVRSEVVHAPPSGTMRNADDYTVQYQGQLQGERRLVRLAGACETHGRTPSQLKEAFVVIFDGGNCYFDATYDPGLRRFTAFAYHGVR